MSAHPPPPQPPPKDAAVSYPAVILAAGEGQRMGGPKGLLDYRGRPWIAEQLRRFATTGGRYAVVVIAAGPAGERVRVAVDVALAAGDCPQDVRVVENPKPSEGPFSSLQCGLAELAREGSPENRTPWAWVLPVDVPCAEKAAFVQILRGIDHGTLGVSVAAVSPTFGGRGGHPVLLSKAFVKALLGTARDRVDARLDMQLRQLPPGAVIRIPVEDAAVVQNMNRPDDFAALLEQ